MMCWKKIERFMNPLPLPKECCNIKQIERAWWETGRATQARICILKLFGATVPLINTSYEMFDLAETWRGNHEISNVIGFNSGYCFLGTTLSVNGLLRGHYLPADRADSLVVSHMIPMDWALSFMERGTPPESWTMVAVSKSKTLVL